jgi:ferredoxin
MLDRDAWSTLMLLSAGKEVRILTGDCAACQDVKACAIGVGALNELLSQWTLPNNMKIEIVPWDGVTVQAAEANKPLSRSDKKKKAKLDDEKRDRKKLLEMGTKKLKSMIPGMLAEETYNVSRTRTWLLEALGRAPGHKIPFQALKINEKCTVCGFCARVCPQEALTHTKDDNAGTGAAEESASAAEIAKEAELAGANASADTTPTDRVPANRAAERFIYQAALCCHCQRCMKICGPQALTMVDMELDLRFLQGKILLHEMVPRFCVGCDRQIYHKLEPGLCIGCAKEDPELKGVLY